MTLEHFYELSAIFSLGVLLGFIVGLSIKEKFVKKL